MLDLSVRGITLRGSGRVWVMTGDAPVRESLINETPKALSVAPISISTYAFEKQ